MNLMLPPYQLPYISKIYAIAAFFTGLFLAGLARRHIMDLHISGGRSWIVNSAKVDALPADRSALPTPCPVGQYGGLTAMVHMTKTLAVQLGRHGITVNCIHPGTTRTERTPSLLPAPPNWAYPQKVRSGTTARLPRLPRPTHRRPPRPYPRPGIPRRTRSPKRPPCGRWHCPAESPERILLSGPAG
jgi:NAD(P)-dependent dehydrogenase (short-subunit alcohol dehydrogenase family)